MAFKQYCPFCNTWHDDKEHKIVSTEQTNADIQQLIEDCKAREEKLTTWEHDFIVSIEGQLATKGSLSPKQLDRLNIIWEKVT